MKVNVTPFGTYKKQSAFCYTFTSSKGAGCTITNLGGAVIAIRVPDKKGDIDNVVLGFDDIKQYISNPGFLGALIGPVGNRISNAEFTFDGKHYTFAPNENGKTLLHSVPFGFDCQIWDAEAEVFGDKGVLTLKHAFPHSETGFPGNLEATVKYTFAEDNTLRIDYDVTSDAPSFLSPTNHTYFNLAGTGKKKNIPYVNRQTVQIFADKYTRVDADSIPIENAPVNGTPFDLRQGVKLGDGFALEKGNEQLTFGCGYDHNFILSEQIDLTGLRPAAVVNDRISGRTMCVFTDMPAVQLYTANHLRRYNAAEKRWYGKRKALCLETQCTPDSIHHPGEDGFTVATVDKDHPFHSATVYAFSVNK